MSKQLARRALRTTAAEPMATADAPTCATGPVGRLGFVLTELRDLVDELSAARADRRRTTREQH